MKTHNDITVFSHNGRERGKGKQSGKEEDDARIHWIKYNIYWIYATAYIEKSYNQQLAGKGKKGQVNQASQQTDTDGQTLHQQHQINEIQCHLRSSFPCQHLCLSYASTVPAQQTQ